MRVFSSRHPLFVAACVAVAAVWLADFGVWWGVAVALVAGPLLGGWRAGTAWALCGVAAAGMFAWKTTARDRAERILLEQDSGVEVVARVLLDARGQDGFWAARVRLTDGPARGARVWWKGGGAAPVAGSVIRAKGSFTPPASPRNPGEFDEAEWMRRQGMAAVFMADRGTDGALETGAWARRVAAMRAGFRKSVTDGLDDGSQRSDVIRAVVLGEHPADAGDLIMDYRHSGTLHVFCVSGLHVGMVGLLGWGLLRWSGVPRRWSVLALLPLMFGYAWMTGNGPPAVRAAWMAMVFLMAFVMRRRPDLLNALGAVLLAMLLWDGRMLFHPGVQLSYGVVCAIAVGVGITTRWYAWLGRGEPYLPADMLGRRQMAWLWLRRKTAQSLAVSTAAWTGSTPLTAWHFGLITPASIPATVLQIPVIFPLLGAALLSAALHPLVPAGARGINQANGRLADASVFIARTFATLPGGNFRLQKDREPHLMVYDLDFGGAAACFADGKGGGVLFDCGDRYSFKKRVAPSLYRLGIVPDAVVLSHPDGGHLGGGAQVWETFPIRQALLPVGYSRSPAYREWLEAAPVSGVRTQLARAGQSLPLPDGARLEILHVAPESSRHASADERVMICRLHWHGWKILLTSDAGMGLEKHLLDSGADLAADVVIAGRPRNDLSLCDDFIDAVRPLAIIASNSPYPPEERLDPAQTAYWRSLGIQVLDSMETGAVIVKARVAGGMEIHGFVNGRVVTLSSR
jgi:competence protein ComEC